MKEKKERDIYTIKFLKNGVACNYLIPATSELNAAVRLGQIYGDDREYREDLTIEITEIKRSR